MAISSDQMKKLNSTVAAYRGWIAFLVGFVTGLAIGFFTHNWQLLSLSAVLAGLFATSYKRGLLYGSISILAVYAFFLLIYIFTTPAFQVMDIFIGIIGISNMGILGFLITLLIGFLIGLTGGYLGSAIHAVIPWPATE